MVSLRGGSMVIRSLRSRKQEQQLSKTRMLSFMSDAAASSLSRRSHHLQTRCGVSTFSSLPLHDKSHNRWSSSRGRSVGMTSGIRKQSSRPRLRALQEQLETDEAQNAIVKIWNKPPSTETIAPESEPKLSLEELRKRIDALPPVPDKLLLTDKFQRHHSYLRLSLAERCNLRCQYCMPPEGVPLSPSKELLSTSELLTITRMFVKSGVTKIRLTGGEPLLRKDLVEIVKELSAFATLEQIGITTNGVTLSSSSNLLEKLRDAGLTHINISLDTLDPVKFQELTRRNAFDKVWRSIECASEIFPKGRVKLNMVVMNGINHEELADFCLLTERMPNLDVRFIEWMPFSDNGWDTEKFLSYQEMLTHLKNDGIQLQRISDGPNDTTKWYQLKPDTGRIGFITSMSEHFCSTCNRLRLTANGQIKVCLFGTSEISLRDALRENWSPTQLDKLIHYAVQQKTFSLGGHGDAVKLAKHSSENRPMTLIGG